MAIIVPCAGQSSRFPKMLPKYLLEMPDGRLMFEHAVEKWADCIDQKIIFVVLKDHDIKHNSSEIIQSKLSNAEIVLVDPTKGPAETVYKALEFVDENECLFIQDVDSHFKFDNIDQHVNNFVCTVDLRDRLDITRVAAKSFVTVNDQDIVTNIVEKSVVSNFIIVGGYFFSTANIFKTSYESLQLQEEIFVSHVIKQSMHEHVFHKVNVTDYNDAGTKEDWEKLYETSCSTIG